MDEPPQPDADETQVRSVEPMDLLRRTYRAWRRDRVARLGAGLAYYALFALVPLLTITIGLAGLAYSQTEVQDAVQDTIAAALEIDRKVVSEALSDTASDFSVSTGLGLIGVGSLLLTASLVFVALQDALDVIWHVPVVAGLERTIRRRAAAFGIILLVSALLIAVVAVQSLIGLVEAALPSGRVFVGTLTKTLARVLSWSLLAGAVALVLRILPRTRVRWRAAVIGGLVTSALLAVGSVAFVFYLRTFAVGSAGGAAGGVLLVLLWFYYMSQIFLGGAVLTRQIDEHTPT